MSNWAVLVCGGTPGDFYGHADKRPWPDMGQQVSFFEALGKVYDSLESELGADHIIVIAGLKQVRAWLEVCASRGYPPPSNPADEERCKAFYKVTTENVEERKQMWAARLQTVLTSCSRIIQRGGADYDGTLVNPATVCDILRGHPVPGGSGRQIPEHGVNNVFLWLTSHGGHHAVSIGEQEDPESKTKVKPVPINPGDRPCDVCHEPHNNMNKTYSHGHSSLATREWFIQFGHRAPDLSMYGPITTAGWNMDPKSSPMQISPLTRLYWQQMFAALQDAWSQDPGRQVILLLQFDC